MTGSVEQPRRRIPLDPVVRAVWHRHPPPDLMPLTPPPPKHDSVVDWALYVDGCRQPVANYREAMGRARAGEGFVWIGMFEPSEVEFSSVAFDFGLHPLAVEDTVHAHQRPKLDAYEGSLFMVLKTVRYVPHKDVNETSQIVESGEVMVFLGEHYVVTVRHGEHGRLGEVRHRLEANPQFLAYGPSAVLHGICDSVVDAYVGVTDSLQVDVDQIEATVFSDRHARDISRIYQLKRELMELRRAITPLVSPLAQLSHRPSPLVNEQVREYLRDVEDHLVRVAEQVSGYDELLSTVVGASLAKLSIAENEDMRKLAAWAAIFAVPTAISAIYGMNFRYMPELGWEFAYPFVLLVILVACVLLYRGFKRNGWL